MERVYLLQHVHEHSDGNEDVKVIGIYKTEGSAELAIERLKLQSGFAQCPDGFYIDGYELDKDNWQEGFVTV